MFDKLIGKTIAKAEEITVREGSNDEYAVRLTFTDGTTHTFILSSDVDQPS
jgi:hypothetical protein